MTLCVVMPANENRSQRRNPISGAIGGACFWAIPGIVLAGLGSTEIGLALVLIGAPIGVILGLGYAVPGRLSKLLFAVIVARNIPSVRESALNWVDEGDGPEANSIAASDRLLEWLAAAGTGKRRGWWVLLALLAGIATGGALTVRDISALAQGKPGLVLPMSGAKDSLQTQAVIASLCLGVWAGAVMGIVVSSAYRRPILFAVTFAGYLSSCIALAIAGAPGAGAIVVGFTTAAAGMAMLVAALVADDAKSSEMNDQSSAEND